MPTTTTHWWDETLFDLGQVYRWEIGDLDVWVQREPAEWRLAYRWVDGDREAWSFEAATDLPDEGVKGERFAVGTTSERFRLRARTPDRSVVARPRTPLSVPPGHEARFYVSSPLWVEVSVGAATPLTELPSRRLSNTWFGPSTREGELAFSLKTNARTSAQDLPRPPHRFITPVVIDNQAGDTLKVERLNLPVPMLSLFEQDGVLWSESARLLRSEAGDHAQLDVRPGPPPDAAGAVSLGRPRQESGGNDLFRAFSSILRLGSDD